MDDKLNEITTEDILLWIHRHKDDDDAMTTIALASYPYSRKYKERYPDNPQDVHM